MYTFQTKDVNKQLETFRHLSNNNNQGMKIKLIASIEDIRTLNQSKQLEQIKQQRKSQQELIKNLKNRIEELESQLQKKKLESQNNIFRIFQQQKQKNLNLQKQNQDLNLKVINLQFKIQSLNVQIAYFQIQIKNLQNQLQNKQLIINKIQNQLANITSQHELQKYKNIIHQTSPYKISTSPSNKSPYVFNRYNINEPSKKMIFKQINEIPTTPKILTKKKSVKNVRIESNLKQNNVYKKYYSVQKRLEQSPKIIFKYQSKQSLDIINNNKNLIDNTLINPTRQIKKTSEFQNQKNEHNLNYSESSGQQQKSKYI